MRSLFPMNPHWTSDSSGRAVAYYAGAACWISLGRYNPGEYFVRFAGDDRVPLSRLVLNEVQLLVYLQMHPREAHQDLLRRFCGDETE